MDPETGEVNPQKIILSWIGVSGFAMSFRGTVVLLDAWVPRGLISRYVPTSPTQLAQLAPQAIFIGHGHFDHAADAAQIAAASGALVVGAPSHCRQVKAQTKSWQTVRTQAIGTDNDAPGTRHDLTICGIDMSVMRHIHSAPKLPDLRDHSLPVLNLPGLCALAAYPTSPADLEHLGTHLLDAEGGTLLYQFRGGDTAITWHDSSGPIPEDAPDLPDALRALPATTVEIGAIQGFNQFTNGLRDPRLYMEALRPKMFVPTHHDNWMPLITTTGSAFERPLAREVERLAADARPSVCFLRDPVDYLNPSRLTF